MGADYFFRMGSTHSVCQDYAIAGVSWEENRAYAIVSDGCSGVTIPDAPGSPFTDYGARLIARMAWLQMPRIMKGNFDARSISDRARVSAGTLGLPRAALDVTLLVAHETRKLVSGPLGLSTESSVVVHQIGDGVVAARKRDSGDIVSYSVSFDKNMPFYMSYFIDDDALRQYCDECKEKVCTSRIQTERKERHKTAISTTELASGGQRYEFDAATYDLVMIMSDGAESFQVGSAPVALEEVLEQLFAIKNYEGEFLTRRCSRFLQKFCVERGWRHSDDFGIAAIHLPKPE
jgi:hypothetical protein